MKKSNACVTNLENKECVMKVTGSFMTVILCFLISWQIFFLGLLPTCSAQSVKILADGGGRFSKVQTVGFANDIKVDIKTGEWKSQDITGYDGVIWCVNAATERSILDLYNYVRKGGRAVVLVSDLLNKKNSILRDTFGCLVVCKEIIIAPNGKDIHFSGDAITPLWKSLTVGMLANGGVTGYLVCKNSKHAMSIMSSESTKTRTVSALLEVGDGKALFLNCNGKGHGRYEYNVYIIQDNQIDLWDNEKAALRILGWAAGKVSYPAPK
jgi:hypothetical protein